MVEVAVIDAVPVVVVVSVVVVLSIVVVVVVDVETAVLVVVVVVVSVVVVVVVAGSAEQLSPDTHSLPQRLKPLLHLGSFPFNAVKENCLLCTHRKAAGIAGGALVG